MDDLGLTETEYRLKVLKQLDAIQVILHDTNESAGLITHVTTMRKTILGNGKMGLQQKVNLMWRFGALAFFALGIGAREIIQVFIGILVKR